MSQHLEELASKMAEEIITGSEMNREPFPAHPEVQRVWVACEFTVARLTLLKVLPLVQKLVDAVDSSVLTEGPLTADERAVLAELHTIGITPRP